MDPLMAFRDAIRAAARRTPLVGRILDQRDQLAAERDALRLDRDDLRRQVEGWVERWQHVHRFVPPDHFYSPLPSLPDIERDAARLFPEPPPRTLGGIDLREQGQMALLEQCLPFYAEMPFTPGPQPQLRYRFDNGAFSYSDAIFLYLMLRHCRPRRVIEVGSGHSSCVTLDTSERFLGNAVETVFIEPYPELLQSLLHPGDDIRIIPERLQDVPLDLFETLAENDILFIDSTHVAKIGSDVTYIFNDILPALQRGVVVHFHDIFYPFEYPRYWFDQGRAWNEAYVLRSFLQYNTAFRIELWNNFLLTFQEAFFAEHMKLCLQNAGASLWLRRV